MDALSFLVITTDVRNCNKIVGSSISLLPYWLSIYLALFCFTQTKLAQAQEETIDEIVVTSTRSRRSFEEQPTRVEVLGSEEINEKSNMKPGDIRMLLNESTGIHVQQT